MTDSISGRSINKFLDYPQTASSFIFLRGRTKLTPFLLPSGEPLIIRAPVKRVNFPPLKGGGLNFGTQLFPCYIFLT
jgi:hypothetical protein